MPSAPISRQLPPDTLKPRQRHALQTRLVRWVVRDTWTLEEASLISFGIRPGIVPAFMDWRRVDTEDLLDFAQRAVRAGNLEVINPHSPISEWQVRPSEYGRWMASRADIVGREKAEMFRDWFPQSPKASERVSVRRAVLESDYSTRLLDIAFAVINEFWIPWRRGQRPHKPKEDEVVAWLAEHHPGLTGRNVEAITTLTRFNDRKAGD